MPNDRLIVKNLRGFIHAADLAGPATKKAVRGAFREVGDLVRVDAAARFASTDSRSAAGFRTVVRRRGVSVEQSIRRTTGRHPEYGAKQMRVLLKSRQEQLPRVDRAFERAADKVADHFDSI